MTRGGKRPGAGRPINKDPKKHTVRLTDSEKDFIDFSRIKLIDLRKLKKSLLVILAMLIFSMPGYSMTLKGGIEYTVDNARVIAFQNTDLTIPISEFKSDLYDVFYYSNKQALKDGQLFINIGFSRKLVPFYYKNKLVSYGVISEDQPNKKLYYSLSGKLLKYEKINFNGVYPYKNIAYDEKGRLVNIQLFVSANESFIFNENKRLLAHWINNQCYDEKGNIIMTRRL